MKKLKLIGITVLLFLGVSNFAQTYVVKVRPLNCTTWGYANLKGELIIPAKYGIAYSFSDNGLAVVYNPETRAYDFIKLSGVKLIPEVEMFYLAEFMGYGTQGYSDGMVAIKDGFNWGYLNTAGKLAIPSIYKEATIFKGGFAIAMRKGNYYVINKKGQERLVNIPDIKEIKYFSENKAIYITKEGNQGFIDTTGSIIIPAQFHSVGYFHNGFAWAKKHDGTVGFINNKGEWVIEPKFNSADDFDKESGLALVKLNYDVMFVDTSGQLVSFNNSEIIKEFSEGLSLGRLNEKVGYYNNKGEWVIQPQFESGRGFVNGYAAVEVNGKWGLIDKQGNWVIEPKFDQMSDVDRIN
jgi:hypothetical protein